MADTPNSSHNWQQAVQAVREEDDPQKLAVLIAAAEGAIFLRFQELTASDTNEAEAMAQAVATLRSLQVKKLKFPVWEGDTGQHGGSS